MRFLTLDRIKEQCIVDKDFHDDDDYLTHLGDVSEELVETEIDWALDEVVATNRGKLPKPLEQAMLLYVDYLYSSNRGSNDVAIPEAIYRLIILWRNYGRTR